MKIDNVSHLTTPTRIDQAKSKEKVGDLAPQANGESQSATHLSRASADTSQDIDHARVAELRQAISDKFAADNGLGRVPHGREDDGAGVDHGAVEIEENDREAHGVDASQLASRRTKVGCHRSP